MKPAVFSIGLVLALLLTTAAAQQPGYSHGPGMMWDGGWFGMFLGPLLMILFIAAIVVLVVIALRWLGGSAYFRHEPLAKTPLDILKERFARGEIGQEEFEERKRILEQK